MTSRMAYLGARGCPRNTDVYLTNEAGESWPTWLPELKERVIGIEAALDADGQRFRISGTHYIWVQEIKDYPAKMIMIAFGGYEVGGRGCFYVPIEPKK